ncbi:MAG: hypothetical protein QM757_45705 [Paludibaculum sp.]
MELELEGPPSRLGFGLAASRGACPPVLVFDSLVIRLPPLRGPCVHPLNVLFRDRHLFILDDHHEAAFRQFIHLREQRLSGIPLQDAQLGSSLHRSHFGPRVIGREYRQGRQEKSDEFQHKLTRMYHVHSGI